MVERLAKENCGKIEERIGRWEQELADLETIDEVFGLSESEQEARREAEIKMDEAVRDETRFWSQRSRKIWSER